MATEGPDRAAAPSLTSPAEFRGHSRPRGRPRSRARSRGLRRLPPPCAPASGTAPRPPGRRPLLVRRADRACGAHGCAASDPRRRRVRRHDRARRAERFRLAARQDRGRGAPPPADLQAREADVERYRQESERQRAEMLNAARNEARELLAKSHADATAELQEAEARATACSSSRATRQPSSRTPPVPRSSRRWSGHVHRQAPFSPAPSTAPSSCSRPPGSARTRSPRSQARSCRPPSERASRRARSRLRPRSPAPRACRLPPVA